MTSLFDTQRLPISYSYDPNYWTGRISTLTIRTPTTIYECDATDVELREFIAVDKLRREPQLSLFASVKNVRAVARQTQFDPREALIGITKFKPNPIIRSKDISLGRCDSR